MSWIDSLVRWFTPIADDQKLATAGALAVAEADRLWQLNIADPPNGDARYAASREQIDAMIRGDQGLGWNWAQPYVRDGNFEWCGAFVSKCWAAGGLPLKPHRYTFFSSTYRLDLWARYRSFNGIACGTKPASGARMMIELDAESRPERCRFPDGSLPRAGDIVLVGDGTPPQGDHITLCASYDPKTGVFSTIEGNAIGGTGPDGRRRQGVIKAERKVGGVGYCARRVIRPGASDLG